MSANHALPYVDPMKKIAKTLRAHRELILNYFKAKKQFSSGVVEGLNNKVKVTNEKILTGSARFVSPNLRSIMHLASCQSRN
jgi:transposase